MPALRIAVPYIIIGILTGCATTKTVKEVSAFTGDFSKYNVVQIVLVPNPEIEEKYHPTEFTRALSNNLTERHVFSNVFEGPATTKKAQLVLRIKIASVSAPGALGAMFMSGTANSEVKVDCQFIEMGSKRSLASLEATGNSKNMGRSKVGGIGVTTGASYTKRAYQNAAEGIVDYIAEHHARLKKSAQN